MSELIGVDINRAAYHAWVGFWNACMADAGGPVAPLMVDTDIIARALNGYTAPTLPLAKLPATPRDQSTWAAQLKGDKRISDVTLSDVLLGLEDYFKIFRQLKKANPAAYEYFSRVGAPLCFRSHYAFRDDIEQANERRILNPDGLPAYFGIFMTKTKERVRDSILNDTPDLLDFLMYEKRRRNIAVASPWKWTLYDHQQYAMERDHFTKQERRKFPQAGAFGLHYYIGISKEDGAIHALPMQMNRRQTLPGGDNIHHSQFIVPPGLKEWAGDRPVDHFVTELFATVRAFCASATSGVQMSVRRGAEVARFGIPINNVREFFRDRDREGARRKPLLHMVESYQYQRGDRTVTVGEHLRGARKFRWRDYQLVISAPGIHHPAPEALTEETLSDDDILPIPRDVITIGDAATTMQSAIEATRRVPFRRGVPTVRYGKANFGGLQEAAI